MIRLRESGGIATIGTVRLRESGGLVEIGVMRLREADGVHIIHSPTSAGSFEVNAIPLAPYGGSASNAGSAVTTETVTVTASAGVEPYTYAFSQADAEPSWSISVVGTGQARFTRTGVLPNETFTANFICEVTDAAGRKVESPTITATVANYGRLSMPYL